MDNLDISVVVPFFNELDNVIELHRELIGVLQQLGKSFEIIYVNDGSTDGTGEKLLQLKNCTVVEMRRSFGQTAALVAGFSQTKGKIICTMDGDLQNDPNDLPEMIRTLEGTDTDLIIGWRKKRNDSLDKRIPSYFAYLLRQVLLSDGIHDAGCGIKAIKREVVESLELYGEMHRFIGSIAMSKGFRVKEMVVNHRGRKAGKSKYTMSRGAKGFLDMLAVWFWGRYSARPLHLLGGIGLILLLASFFTLFVSFTHIFADLGVLNSQEWIIFGFLEFILGVQMIISGFIADIVVHNYFAMSKQSSFEIKQVYTQ
jgi:glycosyltransferase involved in cell wall biosynthesis